MLQLTGVHCEAIEQGRQLITMTIAQRVISEEQTSVEPLMTGAFTVDDDQNNFKVIKMMIRTPQCTFQRSLMQYGLIRLNTKYCGCI